MFLERARALLRVPGQELRLAETLGNLAKGRLEEAKCLRLESIALHEELFGASHQETFYARWR